MTSPSNSIGKKPQILFLEEIAFVSLVVDIKKGPTEGPFFWLGAISIEYNGEGD
ncbi:hypothetical protein BGP_0712 [Beggiatoa sp. PS]|nr:hypothetical protein BGP_0712 [Beggiatoa sp. PS]